MLLEFFERIGSLVPEYWSLKPNFKPEINSFFLSGRGYSINDFSTISAFIGEFPMSKDYIYLALHVLTGCSPEYLEHL
jgi:hypothetical protein